MKDFKTIMMAGGAAVALLAFEPTTLLLKLAISAAVGAVLADPLAEKLPELKKQLQAMRKQMSQKPVDAVVVN